MIYVLFSRKPHKTKQHVYHYNTTHAIPVAVCCSQLDEFFLKKHPRITFSFKKDIQLY